MNNHLNNGRYLSLLDLASIDLFLRSGIFKKMLKMRLKPMVGGAIVTYRKGLSLFERCTLTMQLDAWDDRWSYFRFAFKNAQGALSATGYFKGALVSKKGFYPNQEFIEQIGFSEEKNELPMAVAHWIASEKAMVHDQAK
jgi:acyl-CoA thioesterase FadM